MARVHAHANDLPDGLSPGLADLLTGLIKELHFKIEYGPNVIQLKLPCATPLHLGIEPRGDQLFVYFVCRTWSGYWPGERTDVHDLYSTYLACRLATSGLASCSLIDVPHPVTQLPGEIFARLIIPEQPSKGWYTDDSNGRKQLEALIRIFWNVEAELHNLGGPCEDVGELFATFEDEKLKRWACRALESLDPENDNPNGDMYMMSRNRPGWFYFNAPICGYSGSLGFLALFLEQYAQGEVEEQSGPTGQMVRRGELENAWNNDDYRRIIRTIETLNEGPRGSARIIPLENRLVVVSGRYLIAQHSDTGKAAFHREVERTLRLHDEFTSWARPIAHFEWASPMSSVRFEQLTHALLLKNSSVIRVRQVGSTNDRDGGRDFIVDMMLPVSHMGVSPGRAEPILRDCRVLVQCKTKRDPARSIGKSDVLDIRDTIERYDADGYWLFVSSHVTSSLVDHFEALAKRFVFVDWWTRSEIEGALLENPRLVEAFSDVVRSG